MHRSLLFLLLFINQKLYRIEESLCNVVQHGRNGFAEVSKKKYLARYKFQINFVWTKLILFKSKQLYDVQT